MPIQRIMALIDEVDASLILLLCHHNADPDAVCAAYALAQLLRRLRPKLNIEIAAAGGPSRLSKFLLRELPAELTTQPPIKEADILILLDTNTIQQLDEWVERVKASNSPLIVIDHHAAHPETERLATICMADEEASSTCEIIYNFFKEMKVELTETEAKALFLGMAFDTRHFVLAKSSTFKAVAELVDVGVKPEEALSLLSLPMESPERIARLKAGQRLRLIKINDWLIALSHVGAYQASAARALIGLGAHVAIVAGQRGESIQVSLRSSRDFHKGAGIHLGRDIANPLGVYLHGMGGGHATSAGANGVGDLETSLKHCVSLLKDKVK